MWVVADIYEYELPNLKVGDTATIRLSYFPGKEFQSRIDYLSPTLWVRRGLRRRDSPFPTRAGA